VNFALSGMLTRSLPFGAPFVCANSSSTDRNSEKMTGLQGRRALLVAELHSA
jgi:hypothetical protein